MLNSIRSKTKEITTTALSLSASVACFAEAPNSDKKLEGSIQSSLSHGGNQHTRTQLKFEDLTLTAISAPMINSNNNQKIVGLKLDQETFSFELAARESNQITDFRAGAELHLKDGTDIGLVSLWGDRDPYSFAYLSHPVTPEIHLDSLIDTEGDFRIRTLLDRKDKHLSLTLGMQDSAPLAAVSFNNKNLWIGAQTGEAIPSTLKIAIGKIKPGISRSFDGYEAAGRNELPDFPEIHTVPIRNSLGASPSFTFGGRSPPTFLGDKAGDMALMAEWRENSVITSELALRLPSIARLKDTYLMPGYFNLLDRNIDGFSLETGMKFNQFGIRVRSEIDSTGERRIGLLGEFRF